MRPVMQFELEISTVTAVRKQQQAEIDLFSPSGHCPHVGRQPSLDDARDDS